MRHRRRRDIKRGTKKRRNNKIEAEEDKNGRYSNERRRN